jgi:hypothetical protein
MRIITHGPLDTLDATATLAECIDQEHLMDIVARSTIRGGAQPTGQGGHGRPVSESLETGTLEGGAAIAVITVDGLVGPIPIGGRRHVIVETTELLCNRLGLVLTRRGNPDIESDFHGAPPDEAMGQDIGLRSTP